MKFFIPLNFLLLTTYITVSSAEFDATSFSGSHRLPSELQPKLETNENTGSSSFKRRPVISERRALECLTDFQNVVLKSKEMLRSNFKSDFINRQNGAGALLRTLLPLMQGTFRDMFQLLMGPRCEGIFLPPFASLRPSDLQSSMNSISNSQPQQFNSLFRF